MIGSNTFYQRKHTFSIFCLLKIVFSPILSFPVHVKLFYRIVSYRIAEKTERRFSILLGMKTA